MNRREFLQCAALLAAGSVKAPASWALTEEQSVFLAGRKNFVDSLALTFFTAPQRAAVAAVSEQIIPATDTPGAGDAGVPRFVELMVSLWFNDAERELFMAGLDDLQQRAGGHFAGLDSDAQRAQLEAMEAEVADAEWFGMGNVMRIWDSEAPFLCQFKELVVLGFFLSEVGATQVLREMPMGTFDGDIPLGPDDTAWASELPIRLLTRA
jgi:hypothetical protein